MVRLIDDLLDASQINRNKTELRGSRVSLATADIRSHVWPDRKRLLLHGGGIANVRGDLVRMQTRLMIIDLRCDH